ncbi:MscL family protein, partial [Mycobacterium tuberculosis]|nr:MscL family protein [Mycobacterium tuberculosis]
MTYDALKKAGVPVLADGNFVAILMKFIILAFIMFMLVKAMNRLRRQSEAQEAAAPEPSEEVLLLRE